jgi:hypothetical protein
VARKRPHRPLTARAARPDSEPCPDVCRPSRKKPGPPPAGRPSMFPPLKGKGAAARLMHPGGWDQIGSGPGGLRKSGMHPARPPGETAGEAHTLRHRRRISSRPMSPYPPAPLPHRPFARNNRLPQPAPGRHRTGSPGGPRPVTAGFLRKSGVDPPHLHARGGDLVAI